MAWQRGLTLNAARQDGLFEHVEAQAIAVLKHCKATQALITTEVVGQDSAPGQRVDPRG